MAEAAAEIGCHPEYLRRQMARKKWDLGNVVPPEKPGGQHEYRIFRAKLDRFLGKEVQCG
ncbi:MAG: hypothetical protein J6C37_00185 [Roseburia sp.]|nr:hypothetical protein [Roseburia sp.]